MSAGPGSHLEATRGESAPRHIQFIGRIQFQSYRREVPVSLWAVASGYSQLLEAYRTSWLLVPFVFKANNGRLNPSHS